MKKSVGLVAMTRITENEPLMAVLQRRGEWNTEKGELESYPGCIQVTCHGKLENTDADSFQKAIIREAREELGEFFSNWLNLNAQLTVVKMVTTSEKKVITYSVIVPFRIIRNIRLGPDTGGLCWMTTEMMKSVIPIRDDMRQLGSEGLSAMFPDEIEAVRNAFEIFGQ